jgi:hypothetical protein
MRSHRKFTAITTSVILSLSFLTVTTQSAKAASYQVSILSGQSGTGDFLNPRAVSVAPNGDVYVADSENYAIKKIATNGAVSVLGKTTARENGSTDESFCSVYAKSSDEIWAGNCNNTKLYRYLRGNLVKEIGLALPFTSPTPSTGYIWGASLVMDTLGGIYLSDERNHIIMRVDEATGRSAVYAGQAGILGNSDAGKGLFNTPRGLAIDSKNNLFVVDAHNGAVRKITPDGKISTVANGLNYPVSVAVDSSDSVYVATENWGGSTITKIGSGKIFDESATKIDTKLLGNIIGQPSFNPNAGLSIDSRSVSPTNNLYITDGVNHSVKVYSSSGQFVRNYGSPDRFGITAPGSSNQIYMNPNHTFPLADGSYLVLDNYTLRHVSDAGEVLKVNRLERYCGYTAGAAFLADGTFFCSMGNYIEVRFPDGTWTRIGNTTAGRADGNAASARFNRTEGMAVYKGEIYVADGGNGQIRKIRSEGIKDFQVTTFLGTGTWAGGGDVMTRAKANFGFPTKLTIDRNGNLYIADGSVDSVYRTTVLNEFSGVSTDVTRVGRGLGSWPSAIVADGRGIVFVSGWGGKLFKIEDNKMSYFSGSVLGNKLGATDSALFNRPTGLSIDMKGNLIVADRDNQQIKKIDVNSLPNPNTDWPKSIYSPYLAVAIAPSSGLTAENDRDATAKIIAENRTGLISRIYQGANVSIPNRDTTGLTLCSVSHVGMAELALNSRPIFEGSGCNNKRFLVKYNGFITWPESGKQTRTIYTSSIGGVFVKINGESVISKWDELGGVKTWPFDKSSVLTLQGGKQYPIEVWYYRNQLNTQDSATLNLYWSAAPNTKLWTYPITETYFSPAKSESEDLVEAPISPSKPTVSINLNFINLKVRVPVNATSVILFAPEFGVTKAKPIVGKVKSGLASFEVAVSSKFAGKKGTLQLVSGNAAGESQPLKIPVTVPKVATKTTPKVKELPKPQTAPNQPKVNCKKGAQERPFDGSCPPGWENS